MHSLNEIFDNMFLPEQNMAGRYLTKDMNLHSTRGTSSPVALLHWQGMTWHDRAAVGGLVLPFWPQHGSLSMQIVLHGFSS